MAKRRKSKGIGKNVPIQNTENDYISLSRKNKEMLKRLTSTTEMKEDKPIVQKNQIVGIDRKKDCRTIDVRTEHEEEMENEIVLENQEKKKEDISLEQTEKKTFIDLSKPQGKITEDTKGIMEQPQSDIGEIMMSESDNLNIDDLETEKTPVTFNDGSGLESCSSEKETIEIDEIPEQDNKVSEPIKKETIKECEEDMTEIMVEKDAAISENAMSESNQEVDYDTQMKALQIHYESYVLRSMNNLEIKLRGEYGDILYSEKEKVHRLEKHCQSLERKLQEVKHHVDMNTKDLSHIQTLDRSYTDYMSTLTGMVRSLSCVEMPETAQRSGRLKSILIFILVIVVMAFLFYFGYKLGFGASRVMAL